VQLAGVVLTMLQSGNEDSIKVAQEAWRLFPADLVLETAVPRDNVFLKASAEGVPLGLLRRKPPAVAAVFDLLASEIEPRLALEPEPGSEESVSLLG
jgi:chromosome partitioning protein